MDVNSLIATEIRLYVQFCNLASQHDENEDNYKQSAHVLFYHIQEMRSTGKIDFSAISLPSLDNVKITPIS